MSQKLGLHAQEQTISSTSASRKEVESSSSSSSKNKALLAGAQLAAIIDALMQIQAHSERTTALKVDAASSKSVQAPALDAPDLNPTNNIGSVGASEADYKSKKAWKKFLVELLALLSSGNSAALAKFLKTAGAMLKNLGLCPSALQGKIKALLKEVFSKFLAQKDAMKYMAELYAIYYQELKQQGDPNAAQDAQKMLKDLFSDLQSKLGIDVSAYYKDGNFTSNFTNEMNSYQDKSLSELFEDLLPAAYNFFNTDKGGIFKDIEGYLNSAYKEIVKDESFWEKVMDVMNIWSYLYSNASMAKFNNVANIVNKVKQIIAEMQNDLNIMISHGGYNKSDSAGTDAAKDFAKKYKELQKLDDNPALGDPNSPGTAANSLQNFLRTLGSQEIGGGYNIGGVIKQILDGGPGVSNPADYLAEQMKWYFHDSHSKTPTPVAQSINTDFTNAESTYSTLAQTTGMQVQNQSTNMDTLIKLSNSARNIMNQLIRPMTTYSGS